MAIKWRESDLFYRAIPALRLIDLAQDAIQLLLGQDVKIHQRIQLNSAHHGRNLTLQPGTHTL